MVKIYHNNIKIIIIDSKFNLTVYLLLFFLVIHDAANSFKSEVKGLFQTTKKRLITLKKLIHNVVYYKNSIYRNNFVNHNKILYHTIIIWLIFKNLLNK